MVGRKVIVMEDNQVVMVDNQAVMVDNQVEVENFEVDTLVVDALNVVDIQVTLVVVAYHIMVMTFLPLRVLHGSNSIIRFRFNTYLINFLLII